MPLGRLMAIVVLFLSLVALTTTAGAVSNEESSFLAMYFSDEELEIFSATRSLKSVASVAENVVVVTAEDIEIMNAHTVAEALYNITGIEMEFFKGPGSGGSASIHGAGRERVMVLLDGVPFHTGTNAFELSTLPVQMVRKIEIIKGPASSTWGSSFGGVINVITKSVESGDRPGGTVSASAGKGNTSDVRAEVSGSKDRFGLYLYGGRMDSDGIREGHRFTHENFFGRVNLDAGPKTRIDLSFLYHRRDSVGADFLPDNDVYIGLAGETLNGKADIRTSFADNVVLVLSGWWNRQDDNFYVNQWSTDVRAMNARTLYERYGYSGKLVWRTEGQTLVAGAEAVNESFEQEFESPGPIDQRKFALFVNDSLAVGNVSATAGLRYDHSSLAGGIVSPSLGATWLASRDLLFRAHVSRGFHAPGIVRYLDAPPRGYYANEQLAPEKIWSYQVGSEANVADLLRAKLTLFYHDIDDVLIEETLDSKTFTLTNGGRASAVGGEFEIATNTFKGFVFKSGAHYEQITLKNFTDPMYFDVRDIYGVNATLAYDGHQGLKGVVKAHYLWWDMTERWLADSKGIVVDLSLAKKILDTGKIVLDLFAGAHNIFNAHSYSDHFERNPDRWLEAGVRCTF